MSVFCYTKTNCILPSKAGWQLCYCFKCLKQTRIHLHAPTRLNRKHLYWIATQYAFNKTTQRTLSDADTSEPLIHWPFRIWYRIPLRFASSNESYFSEKFQHQNGTVSALHINSVTELKYKLPWFFRDLLTIKYNAILEYVVVKEVQWAWTLSADFMLQLEGKYFPMRRSDG
jgi:hypothetical protein